MPSRIFFIAFFSVIMLLMDWYVYSGFRVLIQNMSETTQKVMKFGFWGLTFFNISLLLVFHSFPSSLQSGWRVAIMTFLFAQYFGKLFWIIFLFLDDIIRFFRWIISFFTTTRESNSRGISRSEFIVKAGMIAGAGIITSLTWGIFRGAYDYRVRRRVIPLKNLPDAFDGLRILQISDIHAGSFWDMDAVKRGVDLVMEQEVDVIFFTGDLVNNLAAEMEPYQEIFDKIKAPMGVYSVLGNHDYGDYVGWDSPEEKKKNLDYLKEIHRSMGWKLLMNEHVKLTRGNDSIGVLGIENWGNKGRFPKYGKMHEAVKGTEDLPVKLLLSHDPSHWRGQVIPEYPYIDVMFSGHTHGMQFGVEVKGYKWSPVKYMYAEWADLYSEGHQHLYVNRGFGFLGYPGRFGILPEITVVELRKS